MSDHEIRIQPLGDAAEEIAARLTRIFGPGIIAEPDDARALVVMTREDLAEIIEDAQAEAAHRLAAGNESVPIALADRLLAGENPVRVWREHRGMTVIELAERTGIAKGYLSQIERAQRAGPVKTLRRIAEALGIDVDDLV